MEQQQASNGFSDEQVQKVAQIITGEDIRGLMEPFAAGQKEAYEAARDALIEAKFDAVVGVLGKFEDGTEITKEWMAAALTTTCADMLMFAVKQTLMEMVKDVFQGADVKVITDPEEIVKAVRGDATVH